MSERLTTEEFIRRAKAVHGDRYDYSQTEYRGNHRKVTIFCPEHGEFRQLPPNHYRYGCRKCAEKKARPKLTTETFIARAETIHGRRYDYSQVNYEKLYKKVEVICPEHGSFWVRPNNHLYGGNGCPTCAQRLRQAKAQIRAERRRMLQEASIKPTEIVTTLEMISEVMAKEGMVEFAGRSATWFSGAALIVEGLAQEVPRQ